MRVPKISFLGWGNLDDVWLKMNGFNGYQLSFASLANQNSELRWFANRWFPQESLVAPCESEFHFPENQPGNLKKRGLSNYACFGWGHFGFLEGADFSLIRADARPCFVFFWVGPFGVLGQGLKQRARGFE